LSTAWALLAVSSDSQGDTLEHQRAWAEETAAAKGWTIVKVLGEGREGVGSGKAGPRPIVRRLIAELRALPPEARPEWLLIIRSDRFARGKIQDTLFVQDEIINDLGVRIMTRNDGEILMNSPEAEFMASFKGYYARKDNADRRDKATAVYKRKRAAGQAVGNKRPYGLALDASGHDIAVADQAEAIKMAFDLRAAGQGYHVIAARMLEAAPPVRYRKSGERAIKWTSLRIRKLLANRSYVGPVVDEVTFRRAQQVRTELARPAGQHRHPWPLTGAIRCYCGTMLIGQATGKGMRFRYYTCRATWNHDGHFRLNPAVPLERQFVALLKKLAAGPDLIAQYRRANLTPASPALLRRNLRSLRAELVALDQRHAKVWELFEAELVRREDVQGRIDAIAGERVDVAERIDHIEVQLALAQAATQQNADVAAVFAVAAATYEDSDVDHQRSIARAAALSLGGLCVEEDRTLTVRRPAGTPNRQAKRL
jgi:DNA invertase Pin-like site-specific DNA recombinase